jgi:large subunit ribosomal protein L18
MAKISNRERLWARRKRRVRKQVARCERPLLTFFRSTKHIYAQLVDPLSGKTLTSVSTLHDPVADGLKSRKDKEAAKRVGTAIAKLALERNIQEVTFNRNGFVYTGRVKALADAAREAGLRF